jgi:ribosomal protein S4
VKVGDVIDLKPRSRKVGSLSALEAVDRRGLPQWLELDKKNFRGTVTALPEREDVTMPIERAAHRRALQQVVARCRGPALGGAPFPPSAVMLWAPLRLSGRTYR